VLRSALVVAVPEAAAMVDGWRERTCQAKPSTGVPAHITILWPFVPAARIDDALLANLHSLFETTDSFTFELRTAARFPETLYLVPEPTDRFAHLTRLVFEAYPEHPPYEDAFDAIVPHLTTAQGNGHVLAKAEAEVLPQLPIVARAREALLLEEIRPDATVWRPRATFPFCD
jgi:2'-5' RNA ligase superfamily